MNRPDSQRGSAIIMLFVAVALFGMLAYAFTQGTRTSTGWLESERDNASAIDTQDCANAVNLAAKRLEARGCGAMISYNADGTNSAPDAPTDGSCSIYHPKGGGVKDCGMPSPSCSNAELTALAIGDSCGSSIYAGESNGRRFYTNAADLGLFTFDNGSGAVDDQPANDVYDGMANTDILVAAGGPAAPYAAAHACRALGPEWFLPAIDQLAVMYDNKNVGDLDGTFTDGALYWSSWDTSNGNASILEFVSRWANNQSPRDDSHRVRCARYD